MINCEFSHYPREVSRIRMKCKWRGTKNFFLFRAQIVLTFPFASSTHSYKLHSSLVRRSVIVLCRRFLGETLNNFSNFFIKTFPLHCFEIKWRNFFFFLFYNELFNLCKFSQLDGFLCDINSCELSWKAIWLFLGIFFDFSIYSFDH